MSTFEFEAGSVISKHPDGECHLVGFADKNPNTRYYLMLQRALEHDEQDVQLGIDTYHVEWCDQKSARYGGIEQFTLAPDRVEVVFDSETAEQLNDIARLHIYFRLPPAEYDALRQVLGHIFHGSSCFRMQP